MIDIIIDIFFQLVDLYQQFFGVPEGVTYALFGSKKRKKAKKKLASLDNLTADIDVDVDIPDDQNSDFDTSELVEGDVIPGTDTPEVPFLPSFPYLGNQIILNSGRLHLNANKEFILLNAKQSISLAAPGSINIDTEGAFVVNAQKVRLGIGEAANHPLVYGDELIKLLDQMQLYLQKAIVSLKESKDSTGAYIDGVIVAAEHLSALNKSIDVSKITLLSERNFTQ